MDDLPETDWQPRCGACGSLRIATDFVRIECADCGAEWDGSETQDLSGKAVQWSMVKRVSESAVSPRANLRAAMRRLEATSAVVTHSELKSIAPADINALRAWRLDTARRLALPPNRR